LELDPDHARALSNMSNALLATGHPKEAVDLALRSVALEPKYPPAQNNLGAALATMGRYPEAIVHFQEAIRMEPEFAQAYGNLMGAYAALGQAEAAVVTGRKGLDVARATGDSALAGQIEVVLKQLTPPPIPLVDENASGDDSDTAPVKP
jgi:tetratricopeptide (TPR) repeat protein